MRDPNDERLQRLFERYLEALDTSGDVELVLAEASDLADRLRERIEGHERLNAMGRTFGRKRSSPPPPVIGRFRILGRIGEGGLSQVWRAFDPLLKREVALKVLKGALLASDSAPWVLNEARSLARIRHEGVLQVLEIGEDPACPYIAMELLPGPTLRQVIDELRRRRGGPATPTRPSRDGPSLELLAAATDRYRTLDARIECLARLAEALAHCHRRSVLHRDVKPTNVLLDEEFRPRLIDFGLAHDEHADEDSKLDLTTQLVGTAAYLAPEQVDGQRTGADHRSDQFSLGVLGYEWLALEHPFEQETRAATLDAISRCHPRPLHRAAGISPALSAVIHGGLERAAADRYQDLGEYAADLRRVLRHEAPLRSAPSFAHLLRLWLRRHRRGAVVAALAAGAMLSLVLALWVADTAKERNAIRERFAAVMDEEIPGTSGLMERGLDLVDLQPQARAFDGRLLAPLIGRLEPELRARRKAWSQRLGTLCEAALSASAGQSTPFEYQTYRTLFQLDARVNPKSTDNERFRVRGQVLLPPSIPEEEIAFYQLCRLGPDSPLWVLRPTSFTRAPAPGHYRVQLGSPETGRLVAEEEFFMDEGWPPGRQLELRLPRREFWLSSTLVEGSEREEEGRLLFTPAFRVLDHLVTVAEFERFLAATGYESSDFGNPTAVCSVPLTAAAWVDVDSAQAFCSWAGGRLPCFLEALRAQDLGRVSTEPVPDLAGEILADALFDQPANAASWLDYSAPAADNRHSHRRPIIGRQKKQSSGTRVDQSIVGFRVVFSADAPEAYREIER